jgi:hypothetical protein
MNEFLFFSQKIGSLKVDGREYAFCHPLKLENDGNRGFVVTCTVVDDEGNFYDLCWMPWADFSDNGGNPLIKRIGKYEELPVKNIEEIISYLERRSIL